MIKRKLLVTAGTAVLFGCIIFATACMSRGDNSRHSSIDAISTTQVSENILIENGTDNNEQLNTLPTQTSEEVTSMDTFSAEDVTENSTTAVTESEEFTTQKSISDKENTIESTTAEQSDTEVSDIDINSQDNTQFSFSKIIVDKQDYDYYTKLVNEKGYVNINSTEELSEFCKNLLKLDDGKKQVKYIITQKGLFDSLASEMDVLKKNAEDSPVIHNVDKRDRFLYEKLGLDYQQYYSNGVGLFMIKKIQDIENNVGSNSVYAVYYYSYTTKEQNKLQNSIIENAIVSFTGTDYDKILAAHEYLRSHVNYNDNDTYLVHTAYGALVNKQAVCEGYAKAYKLLLNAMGIECDVVINADHAWNVVCLDGEWYLVDVTNDDTNGGLMYFLLGQDELTGDGNAAKYFGYNDNSNTDVRTLSEYSYEKTVITE